MIDNQSHDEVVEKVKSIVAEVLKKNPAEINDEDDFTAIGADSLDRMTLIVMLEDQMECSITDAEARTLTNVAAVVSYIESKRSA